MAPMPMTFSDLEGHLAVRNLSNCCTYGNILSTICLHMKRKARVACNFNGGQMETEGLLDVAGK